MAVEVEIIEDLTEKTGHRARHKTKNVLKQTTHHKRKQESNDLIIGDATRK